MFVALNNWQRGDYKPYLVKSTDRGRTFTSITGNLPDRHDVWSVIQDHVNGNLLFAGTEFGVFTSVDGGARWVQLKGGMPVDAGARHDGPEARERSRASATFGRGFYVLDDYIAAARAHAADARAERGAAVPVARRLHLQARPAWRRRAPPASAPMSGNWTAPNPPFGAVFTYNVKTSAARGRKLVLTITDDNGKQVRRLDLDKRRVCAGSRGTCAAIRHRLDRIRPGQRVWRRRIRRPRRSTAGPLVAPGRYRATLAKVVGDTVTPIGPSQSFTVVQIAQ